MEAAAVKAALLPQPGPVTASSEDAPFLHPLLQHKPGHKELPPPGLLALTGEGWGRQDGAGGTTEVLSPWKDTVLGQHVQIIAPQPSSGASRAKAGLFQPALEEPLGPTTDTRREWRRWAETGQGRGVGARALPSQQSAAAAQGWRHLQHRVAGRAAPHSSPVQCLKRGLHLPEPSIWHLSRAVNSLKKKKKSQQSFNCTFCFSLHSRIMEMALIQCCIEHIPARGLRD